MPYRDPGQTFDFQDGQGPVLAHRHANPDGSLGGWVANSAIVGRNTYVHPTAIVFGFARIGPNVYLEANRSAHAGQPCYPTMIGNLPDDMRQL